MKKNEIKKELIKKIKKNQSWYVSDGHEGILLRPCELNPDNRPELDFYQFSELNTEELKKIDKEELANRTYSDSYGGINGEGEEIEKKFLTNYENENERIIGWEILNLG